MDQLISVIVPVYNVEKYLEKCVDHIRRQTYSNLEIILVDDGSTDQSGKICDQLAKLDQRICVIHKRNGGSSSARNVGMEAAKGAYIGFLDSDDYPELTMYEKLYQVAERTGGRIIQGMSRDFDEEGRLLKDGYRLGGAVRFLSSKEDFALLMRYEGDSSMCTKLIRADFLKQFRFSENKLNEDFELILKMLLQVDGVYSLEEVVYNILIRSGSNQRSGFSAKFYEAMIENSELAYQMMEEQFPSCREETLHFYYYQRMIYLLHIPVHQMTKENECCNKVLKEVRTGRKIISKNPYLDQKAKRNLLILSFLPKLSKRIHGLLMRIKNK